MADNEINRFLHSRFAKFLDEDENGVPKAKTNITGLTDSYDSDFDTDLDENYISKQKNSYFPVKRTPEKFLDRPSGDDAWAQNKAVTEPNFEPILPISQKVTQKETVARKRGPKESTIMDGNRTERTTAIKIMVKREFSLLCKDYCLRRDLTVEELGYLAIKEYITKLK
jgi:hypothetical protein